MSALLGILSWVLWIALIGAGAIPLLGGGRAASATRQAAMIAVGLGVLTGLTVGFLSLGLARIWGGGPATSGEWLLFVVIGMLVPGALGAAAAFGGYGVLAVLFGFSKTALLGTVVLPACSILGWFALNQFASGLAEWERADRKAREDAAIEERSRVIVPRIEVVAVEPAATPGEILCLTVEVTLSAATEVHLQASAWGEIRAHRIIEQPDVIFIGPDWSLSPEQRQANYSADITGFLPAVVSPDSPLAFRVVLTKDPTSWGDEPPGLPGSWSAWLPLDREDGDLMSWTIAFEVPAPPWPSPSAPPSPMMPP